MSAFGGKALQRAAESHLLLILQLVIKTVLPQETAGEAPGKHRASTASSGLRLRDIRVRRDRVYGRWVGLGSSERLVPMYLSTMGPRSTIHQGSRAAVLHPGPAANLSQRWRPFSQGWDHSQLVGPRKVPLRIRSADWLLAHLDSKLVFFVLLIANAVVVVTLTLFVFG